jgi:hypothetical protein
MRNEEEERGRGKRKERGRRVKRRRKEEGGRRKEESGTYGRSSSLRRRTSSHCLHGVETSPEGGLQLGDGTPWLSLRGPAPKSGEGNTPGDLRSRGRGRGLGLFLEGRGGPGGHGGLLRGEDVVLLPVIQKRLRGSPGPGPGPGSGDRQRLGLLLLREESVFFLLAVVQPALLGSRGRGGSRFGRGKGRGSLLGSEDVVFLFTEGGRRRLRGDDGGGLLGRKNIILVGIYFGGSGFFCLDRHGSRLRCFFDRGSFFGGEDVVTVFLFGPRGSRREGGKDGVGGLGGRGRGGRAGFLFFVVLPVILAVSSVVPGGKREDLDPSLGARTREDLHTSGDTLWGSLWALLFFLLLLTVIEEGSPGLRGRDEGAHPGEDHDTCRDTLWGSLWALLFLLLLFFV